MFISPWAITVPSASTSLNFFFFDHIVLLKVSFMLKPMVILCSAQEIFPELCSAFFAKIQQHCCCCSVAQLCPTLCDPMDHSTPDFPVHHELPELAQTLQWCHPTISYSIVPFSSYLQSFPGSGSFSNESALHMRPKYWSFSFSISPSNEYSGLISFRIDWFDLAVQGTLKSLLQHHSLKASFLRCLAFFMVQLVDLYKTAGKTHSFDYTDLCCQSDFSTF